MTGCWLHVPMWITASTLYQRNGLAVHPSIGKGQQRWLHGQELKRMCYWCPSHKSDPKAISSDSVARLHVLDGLLQCRLREGRGRGAWGAGLVSESAQGGTSVIAPVRL